MAKQAMVSEAKARQILRQRARGRTLQELAEKHGLSMSWVSKLATGKVKRFSRLPGEVAAEGKAKPKPKEGRAKADRPKVKIRRRRPSK